MQSETFNPSTISTRFNGLKHGAASKELFLPGENSDEFFALLHDSFRYYKPVSLAQSHLIQDLTEARWQVERRKRIHAEYSKHLHTAKPSSVNWSEADLNRLHRFDRYLTQAERSLQRALTNVRHMHAENARTTKWKEHHERQKQKLEMQRQRFQAAQAREKRIAETYEARKAASANKAVTEIRSAKNAISSPSKSTPPPAPTAFDTGFPQNERFPNPADAKGITQPPAAHPLYS